MSQLQAIVEAERTTVAVPWKFFTATAVLALLVCAPWIFAALLPSFWFKIFTEIIIWSLFAASVNVLFGYVGLLSFGQALYFGVGAYGFAIGLVHFGLGFWSSFAIGIVASLVLSLLVGLVAVRLTSHSFTILTVIFSLVCFFAAVSAKGLTGGEDGLPFSAPSLGRVGDIDLSLRNATVQYYVVLFCVGFCFWLKHVVVRSRLGLAFLAVRENDKRAQLLGYNVYLVRLAAYVLAGFFAGVSGMLFCAYSRYASAQLLYYTTSGEGVIWTIVGGAGTLLGPIAGAAALIVLREELSSVWEHYLLLVGVIVILVTRYAPGGLIGIFQNLRTSLSRTRDGSAP